MNKVTAPSDSVADGIEHPTRCPTCGAITRLDHGFCINCLLSEGLEAQAETSHEAFESILAEDNVADNEWRLGHYEILEEIGRFGCRLRGDRPKGSQVGWMVQTLGR